MPGRWGEIPFVALALLLVAGIIGARFLEDYLFVAFSAGTAGLLAAAVLAFRKDRFAAARSAALASVFVCGVLLALARRDAYPANDLRALISQGALPLNDQIAFDGCVLDQSNRLEDEVAVTLALRAFQKQGAWVPCRGGVSLRIPVERTEAGARAESPLQNGDRVRGWAAWHVPRNFQNPGSSDHAGLLLRRGILMIGRVKSTRLLEVIRGDCSDFWSAVAGATRSSLHDNFDILRRGGHPEQAAILSSLVIGDYSGLSTDTREAFQNSGTYHVLVVSGLHIAWIATVLLHCFKGLRVPPEVSRVLVACMLTFYTGLVGSQASISRSLWMFVLYLAGQAFFRRALPVNITLASAFALLVIRPDWLFDAGFQLSFLSVLAICVTGLPLIESHISALAGPPGLAGRQDRLNLDSGKAARAGRRLRVRCELLAEAAGDGWRPWFERVLLACCRRSATAIGALGSMAIVTISVQLWLEPVLAYHFNRLCWIAPLANLVAVPLSSLALAAGMIAALFSRVSLLAPVLLGLAGRLAQWLLYSAQWIAGLPLAWQRCVTPPLSMVVLGIAILFCWWFAGWRRVWIPWCCTALFLACLAIGAPHLKRPARFLTDQSGGVKSLRITFLDVGEGDSMALDLPGGPTWVVDGGGIRLLQSEQESDRGFDVGEAVVSRYLWDRWVTRLERAILSHPDLDHSGGMPAVLRNFRTARLDYGEEAGDASWARVLAAAQERGTRLNRVRAGQVWRQGELRVDILNPPEDCGARSTNENSVVLRLRYGRFSALFTGDVEKAGERGLLGGPASLSSFVLKVAHHGSRSATSDALLDRVQPRWAVLSSGRNNPFGHPSKDVVSRLLRHGARLLLTQDQGAVTLETDGNRYHISSHVCGTIEQGLLPPTP